MMMNAVSDHLGVGFGGEDIAQPLQVRTQRLVILDDAVVYDGYSVARDVRMGIGRGGNAVGGPPSMRDSHVAADGRCVQGVLQNLDFADRAQACDMTVFKNRDTGRIIAAVFEAAQTVHQDGDCVTLGDHTYDSAHTLLNSKKSGCLVCPSRGGNPVGGLVWSILYNLPATTTDYML